jgi:thioredoxin reductase (NADPH)
MESRAWPCSSASGNRPKRWAARCDQNGETSVRGIYAAGDLVSDINQISVAFGQAAVAAVRIQNALNYAPTPSGA